VVLQALGDEGAVVGDGLAVARQRQVHVQFRYALERP